MVFHYENPNRSRLFHLANERLDMTTSTRFDAPIAILVGGNDDYRKRYTSIGIRPSVPPLFDNGLDAFHNHREVINIQANRMAYQNTVLSLNSDGQTLLRLESPLREHGFEVISVPTPLEARFEIEMGRCGVFVNSYITPFAIYCDLVSLFRRSCPLNGMVVYLADRHTEEIPADIVFSAKDDPQTIVNKLCSGQLKRAS
jgi:hypothetical protein